MSSVRELLEHAAPGAPAAPLPASEVRRLGDRRRRRSTALGATIAVGAVAAAALVGVRAVDGARTSTPPVTGPVTSATPSPPTRVVTGLAGTRWIPDLVTLKVTTAQAYPDEKGNLPRALLTFEPDGRLILDVMLPGRAPISIVGSWSATTAPTASPELSPQLRATVGLDLTAPDPAPQEVTALVAKLDLVTTAVGYLPDGAPTYLEPLTLFLYSATGTAQYGAIDLVQPDAVLPSPYPKRP